MTFAIPKDWTVKRVQEDDGNKLVFLLITIATEDGETVRNILIPMGRTASPAQLVGELKNHGAEFPPDTKHAEVARVLEEAAKASPMGQLSKTYGWKEHGDELLYLSPNGTADKNTTDLVADHRLAADTLCGSSNGTLESWISNISEPARHSAHVSLAIIASLAGCMIRF